MTKRNPARPTDEPDGVADAWKSFGGKELTTWWRDDAASMRDAFRKYTLRACAPAGPGRSSPRQMRRMFRHFPALAIALGGPGACLRAGLEPFIHDARMAPRD